MSIFPFLICSDINPKKAPPEPEALPICYCLQLKIQESIMP